jgi:hypothetical protein
MLALARNVEQDDGVQVILAALKGAQQAGGSEVREQCSLIIRDVANQDTNHAAFNGIAFALTTLRRRNRSNRLRFKDKRGGRETLAEKANRPMLWG